MRWRNQSGRNNKINNGSSSCSRDAWPAPPAACSLQLFKYRRHLIEATNHEPWPLVPGLLQTCQLANNKWRPSVSHVVNMMNACKKCHLLRSSNVVDTLCWQGEGGTQLYVRVANNHVRGRAWPGGRMSDTSNGASSSSADPLTIVRTLRQFACFAFWRFYGL